MVPEIQLMMRVERDAEMQRRPTQEGYSYAADKEWLGWQGKAKRLTHLVSRFAVGSHTLKVQTQGALPCNCAN
jgi:hypothetical protein